MSMATAWTILLIALAPLCPFANVNGIFPALPICFRQILRLQRDPRPFVLTLDGTNGFETASVVSRMSSGQVPQNGSAIIANMTGQLRRLVQAFDPGPL